MFDIKDFYPTPPELINKMLNCINLKSIKTILEPSAGKGNIVDVIKKQYNNIDIDCIEINPYLQSILRHKNYKVVHDDFLTFTTWKHYDLIIMNPPFNGEEGCKHLLKAINVQRNGGQIVCILNAETIKNPCTNTRKDLLVKLKQYDADIEFVNNAFSNAERKTNVEIVLISLKIPNCRRNSVILDHLKQEEQYQQQNIHRDKIVSGNPIEQAIQRYNFEAKAGVKLINEYLQLQPYMTCEFTDGSLPILKLSMYNDNYGYATDDELINKYIQRLRYKYWKTLFNLDIFYQLLTTDLYNQYMERLEELQNYDFSLFNIRQVKKDIEFSLSGSIEDTILDLFDEFSREYSYWGKNCSNIHLYNGWKTNKCWKISTKKVIIPLSGYDMFDDYDPMQSHVRQKLQDIEKVFNYLDGGRTKEHKNLVKTLRHAKEEGKTKKLEFTYFYATFYKKGTCHLEWKNKKLVQKMNLIAAKNRKWLPPSYGKKQYDDMTQEEKDVIDSFQGKRSYNEVIKNKDYYILDASKQLALNE